MEWMLRALAGLGLDANTMLHVCVSMAAFVRGNAASLEAEAQAIRDTGVDDDAWIVGQARTFAALFASGAYPALASVMARPELELDPDSVFAFGLERQLDGLEALIR